MPTKESLDEAARAAGWRDWAQAFDSDMAGHLRVRQSINAHAETLDKLHGRTEMSEAQELWAELFELRDMPNSASNIRHGRLDAEDQKAIALIEAKFAELRGQRSIPPIKEADDGWIEWGGGECPVDPETRVEVKFRDGQTGNGRAINWWWQRGGVAQAIDIIAYRVLS